MNSALGLTEPTGGAGILDSVALFEQRDGKLRIYLYTCESRELRVWRLLHTRDILQPWYRMDEENRCSDCAAIPRWSLTLSRASGGLSKISGVRVIGGVSLLPDPRQLQLALSTSTISGGYLLHRIIFPPPTTGALHV